MRLFRSACPAVLASAGLVAAACGSPPPSTAPMGAPAPTAPAPTEKAVDTSPVPEPPGLVVVGRVRKPEAIVAAVGSWTRLPLPNSRELVRSITDDAVAEVADLTQPIDGAVTVRVARGNVDPAFAFSVVVRGFEEAKQRLGERHRIDTLPSGLVKVEGIAKGERARPSSPPDQRKVAPEEDEDDEDGIACVLAHAAPSGTGANAADAARLVCGTGSELGTLAPYLARTMPREPWSSDLHIEVRPEPVRALLSDLRSTLPAVGGALLGNGSTAISDFVDATLGEVVDVATDTQRITMDAQIRDAGVDVASRFEFQSNKSVLARLMVADRADAPPPAFWHLPEDTDTAWFGRGSDPALFERPRQLLANLLVFATETVSLPEPERKAVQSLVGERLLALFVNGGPGIYAKGFDHAAVERVLRAHVALKPDDVPGRHESDKAIAEQVVGWHLYQVSEPIAKVGPMLKDLSALYNRPAFTKWLKSTKGGGDAAAAAQGLPRLRIAPAPAGVTLPKETVHLEITVPRDDVWDPRAPVAEARPGKPPPKPKMLKRSPMVFHVFAVPDGGATWLAFGLDAKLVAQKAAASLSTAPDAATLGKAASQEALREGLRARGKMNSGGMITVRGLAVLTGLDSHDERSPVSFLGSLPNKGATPMIFTGSGEAPSPSAKAGAATGTFHVSRAVIEDVVKLVFASR